MRKTSLILMAAVLASLSLPSFAQGHSGIRSNRGAQLHGQKRADEVHTLNAEKKKKEKKGKKSHKFAFHHNDKDKGKGKGDNRQH